VIGYPQVVSYSFEGPPGLRGQQLEEPEAQTGHEHLKLGKAEPGDARSQRRARGFESLAQPPLRKPERAHVVSRDVHVVVPGGGNQWGQKLSVGSRPGERAYSDEE
jgi:hypothetical protein